MERFLPLCLSEWLQPGPQQMGEAGKVGEERGESERCCHDMRHGDGPWHERGTFFCPGCLKGELAKTRECPQCEETYCMACIGREGGHACYDRRNAHVDGWSPLSDLVPHPCYTCPTHGFGCDAIWRCDFCSVEACYVEESGRVQLCAYCCGVFVCEDCRRTHSQAREGVIVSKCTDIACDGEEHCFPLCRNGIYPTDGELNPCTGVPCTDDEWCSMVRHASGLF